MADETPEETPEPTPTEVEEPTEPTRWAIYDHRFLRFLRGTYDKKPTMREAKNLAGHDEVMIHEVAPEVEIP